MTKATSARDKFVDELHALWSRVREAPDKDELLRILKMCTTVRGNRFRFLKRTRKSPSAEESVLFERLRWHNIIPGGTGWLGSALHSTWRVDEDTFEKLDSFAMLIGMSWGRVSWTDEWAKAIGYTDAGSPRRI